MVKSSPSQPHPVRPRQHELLPRFHPHKFTTFTSQACLWLLLTLNANKNQKQKGLTACVPQDTAQLANVGHFGIFSLLL